MLTGEFADAWRARGGDRAVVFRDLHEDPPPHLRTPAQHWPERLRGGETLDAETVALQERLIGELCDADALVVGAPMYNFAMPSTLKAWIDLVQVPGVTSDFGAPTQPLRGKPVVVVTAKGTGPDGPPADLVLEPLRMVFEIAFGMEVHTVSTGRTLAELLPDLGVGEAHEELQAALAQVRQLAASL